MKRRAKFKLFLLRKAANIWILNPRWHEPITNNTTLNRSPVTILITCNQSQASVQVTWSVWTNKRSVFRSRDLSGPLRGLYSPCWRLIGCWWEVPVKRLKTNLIQDIFLQTLNFGLNFSHCGKLKELWSVVKDGVNHNRNYEVTRGIFSPEQTKNLLFVGWLFFL